MQLLRGNEINLIYFYFNLSILSDFNVKILMVTLKFMNIRNMKRGKKENKD